MSANKYIVSKTPLRISFAGGGSDLPIFFENSNSYGKVVSTSIDKYVYVTVKSHGEVFKEKIRLNYSSTETVDSVELIKNEIIRCTLKHLNIKDRLYISSIADIPNGTGLGSSSAFTVGLLNCLHAYRGDKQLSQYELAEEAVKIELDLVGSPIGLQDQYGCAIGGFKSLKFIKSSPVVYTKFELSDMTNKAIFRDILLFWTGDSRSANDILKDQSDNTNNKIEEIMRMVDLASSLEESIKEDLNSEFLGEYLRKGWEIKKTLSKKISYSKIDKYYDIAIKNGAIGGKLLGAGGGGFLMLVVPQHSQKQVIKAMDCFKCIKVSGENSGSRIIVNI